MQFALAICGNPDLLFLDEPTVGLDVEARRGFWQQVRRLATAGRTIVLTTHYLEEADALADRVVMLSAGSIVADGAPHRSRREWRPGASAVSHRLPAAAIEALEGVSSVRRDGSATEIVTSDAERVVRQLLLRDAGLSGLEMSGAGLEEAFLTLTSPPGDAPGESRRTNDGWSRRRAMNGTTGTLVQTAAWSPARAYALEAKYEFLKVLRMPGYAIPSIAFPAMFYLLFGVMFGRGTVGGLTMATYLIATYGAFGVIGAALFGFGVGVAIERGQGWMMLKRASPMPPMAFFAAKLAMCTHLRRGRLRRARRAGRDVRPRADAVGGVAPPRDDPRARRDSVLRARPRARVPRGTELGAADRQPDLSADVVPVRPLDSLRSPAAGRQGHCAVPARVSTWVSWRSAPSARAPARPPGATSRRSAASR